MIQCTEPATPAVIVCCKLPPYSFATGSRFRPKNTNSDNCPIREGRGLLSAVASRVVPTLWKRADQNKKDRTSNIQADANRCKKTQTGGRQTVSRVDVTQSLPNNISLPKFIWLAQPRCWPWPID